MKNRLARFHFPDALRWAATTVGLLVGLASGGCARPQLGPLSPQEIAAHGTIEMSAPRDTVFGACILALRMEGYVIDVAEPVTGLVVTLFKRTAAGGDDASQGKRSAGYVVQVRDLGEGRVRIVATPAAGEAIDGSPADVTWDLGHERTAWAQLFADVRMLVARQEGANR